MTLDMKAVSASEENGMSFLASLFARLMESSEDFKRKDEALTAKVEELSSKDEALTAKVEELTSKLAALNSKDTKLTSDVAKLTSKVEKEFRYGTFGEEFVINLSSGSEGRLEVQLGETWGTVCQDSFDTNDAKVVCRHLNKRGGSRMYASWGHGSNLRSLPTLLSHLNCRGNERKLYLCPSEKRGEHNCHGTTEEVWMKCY